MNHEIRIMMLSDRAYKLYTECWLFRKFFADEGSEPIPDDEALHQRTQHHHTPYYEGYYDVQHCTQ